MATSIAHQPTIAIALDAAEADLVRRLMASGELPVLAGLAARGNWSRVSSSANIGSGSVWPTFATGLPVLEHGVHYTWRWEPSEMRIVREAGEGIEPWWGASARRGRRVLTVDVPYLPFADVDGCVEVAEWGSHDRRLGSLQTRPARLAARIASEIEPHPFQSEPAPRHNDPSPAFLAQASRRAQHGARLRGALTAKLIRETAPDLALIVFAEIHHTSHLLWQTTAPDEPLFEQRRQEEIDERALVDVFCAADAAIGAILEPAPQDARVAVFALHGMRPASGIPTLIHPLLAGMGFANAARPGRMSPRNLGRAALAAVKSGLPEPARTAWRRHAPFALLQAVAAPNAMRTYDWSRTRAFPIPHDQHCWLRINLGGREAKGIVAPAEYDATCAELRARLLATRTKDGRPVVESVICSAEENGGGPPAHLPDLVVHWADGAYDNPLQIAGTAILTRPDAMRMTGRHAFDGFLLTAGIPPAPETVASHELHRILDPA